ncbi:uncharacterized protein [Oscarella lobularis]|uniref:uncharacterized protein n=1 Tax=Oscarella lobularis TaxID=121494 RepID=UPI003313ECE8
MAFAPELRATGEFSDISVTVEGTTLNLHKFPLLARSKYFQGLVSSKMADSCSVTLDGLPGGLETMTLVVDFSYNVDMEPKITCENVGPLICAASYLQMTGENNLLDVAKKTFDRLQSKSALNCLQILKGCCRTAVNAESEGIVKQCATMLSYHWTRPKFTSRNISDKEEAVLQELPLMWMPTLLARMKENQCNAEVVAKVIMAVVRWSEDDEKLLEPFYATENETKGVSPDSGCKESLNATEKENEAVLSDLEGKEPEPESDCQETTTVNMQSQLGTVFDAVMGYIPHPSLLKSTWSWIFNSTSICLWYCKTLLFASQYKLSSYSELLHCCSFLQSYLTVEHCKDFPPDLMRSMNVSNYDELCDGVKREKIRSLNDRYLLYHCKQGSISSSGFLAVVSSVSKFRGPTSSFNDSFEAFEALLASSASANFSQEDIKEMSNSIDFAKLNNECLKRAASNDWIPKEIVLSCVTQLCVQLRSDVQLKAQEIATTLGEKGKLEDTVNIQNRQIAELRKSSESLQKKLLRVEAQNRKKESSLEALEKRMRAVEKEKESLQRRLRRYDGFP